MRLLVLGRPRVSRPWIVLLVLLFFYAAISRQE